MPGEGVFVTDAGKIVAIRWSCGGAESECRTRSVSLRSQSSRKICSTNAAFDGYTKLTPLDLLSQFGVNKPPTVGFFELKWLKNEGGYGIIRAMLILFVFNCVQLEDAKYEETK